MRLKIVELYDMIQVRHGMMLVGPTGGGKTKCYKLLQFASKMLTNSNSSSKSTN